MPTLFGIALGASVMLLSACAPQNPTKPARLMTSSAASARASAVATDVQRNTEARHFAVTECATVCKLVHWRKTGATAATARSIDVAVAAAGATIDQIDVAALDDGSAALVWRDRGATATLYRYAVVSDAGAVSGPFNLADAGQSDDDVTSSRLVAVAAGGTRAYATYLTKSGAAGSAVLRLYYRQLLPTASAPRLLDDSSTVGEGYLSAPNVQVDQNGFAHLAWRQVKTGLSGYGAVRYAYNNAPDSPALSAIELARSSGGLSGVFEPALALDERVTPARAWVGYFSRDATGANVLNAQQLRDGASVLTRVHTLPIADGWFLGGAEAPAAGLYGNGPALAFRAENNATGGTSQAYLWNGSGTPKKISTAGNIGAVRVGAITAGNLPLVAYVSGSATGIGQLYVYDSTYSRTVSIGGDVCASALCPLAIDFAVRGDTASGVWLERPLGASSFVAYETRNDNTPQSNILVTTLADTNVADSDISLREALLVANGALVSSFSVAERNQLTTAGCIFNAGGAIIGGCGRGVTDTVALTSTLQGTMTLVSALPAINDSAPTRVRGPRDELDEAVIVTPLASARRGPTGEDAGDAGDGISGGPGQPVAIDGKNVPGLGAIFTITSTGNTLSNFWLLNAQRGVLMRGDGNTLDGMRAFSQTVAGIELDGGSENQLSSVSLAPPSGDCLYGRNKNGLVLRNGAQRNRVSGLRVGCAEYGVVIEQAGTISNALGSLQLGGGIGFHAPQTNTLGGVIIRGGASENVLVLTMSAGAGGGIEIQDAPRNLVLVSLLMGANGVTLAGPAATGNIISGSLFLSNTVDIRQIDGAAHNIWSPAVLTRLALPVDTDAQGAPNPPAVSVTALDPGTHVLHGAGAPAGAQLTIYVRGSVQPFNSDNYVRAVNITADGLGNWSAPLPAAPADDGLLRPGFSNSAEGICVRVLAQSVDAGSGELSVERCFVEAHLPLVLR